MKKSKLKNIIKESIKGLMNEDNSWTHVGGFPSSYNDPFGAFDSSAWAQNFQNSKVAPANNSCNFVKKQRSKLLSKMSNVPGCQNVSDCSNNKHWKRLQIKTSMMLVMLQQNGCPINEQYDYGIGAEPDLGLGSSGMGPGYTGASTWDYNDYMSWVTTFENTLFTVYFAGGLPRACKFLARRFKILMNKFSGAGPKHKNQLASKLYHIYFLMTLWGCDISGLGINEQRDDRNFMSFVPPEAKPIIEARVRDFIRKIEEIERKRGKSDTMDIERDIKMVDDMGKEDPPLNIREVKEIISKVIQKKRNNINEQFTEYDYMNAVNYACVNPGNRACNLLTVGSPTPFQSWFAMAPGGMSFKIAMKNQQGRACNFINNRLGKMNNKLSGNLGPDHEALIRFKKDFFEKKLTQYNC
jgi:hypothetical protein